MTPVYNPIVPDIPISAGLGAFNVSISNIFFQLEYSQIQLLGQSTSVFFEADWTFAMTAPNRPVSQNCSLEPDCTSYFFVGGVESISPYPNSAWKTLASQADSILVNQEQGLQVDYWNMSSIEEDFPASACQTWSTPSGNWGFQICIKQSSLDGITLVAGSCSVASEVC